MDNNTQQPIPNTVNKAFLLQYVERGRSLIMVSEDTTTLAERIIEWHENGYATDDIYIETVFYDGVEELFQYINGMLPKLQVRRKD